MDQQEEKATLVELEKELAEMHRILLQLKLIIVVAERGARDLIRGHVYKQEDELMVTPFMVKMEAERRKHEMEYVVSTVAFSKELLDWKKLESDLFEK